MSNAPDLAFSDAAAPPMPQNGMVQDMRELQNLDWINKTLFPALGQVLAIGVVAAAGLLGPLAGLAAGAAMVAIEMSRAYFANQADLNRELVLYHDDIARVLGKPANADLSIGDMRRAADEKQLGDKALKPLKMELDHLRHRGRYNYIMAAGRAVVTLLGALVMSGSMEHVQKMIEGDQWAKVGGSLFFSLSSALAGVGAATYGLAEIGKHYFNSHRQPSVYRELAQMQQAVKSRTIEPEQVFAVLVKLDKSLAAEVERRFGKPYAELTLAAKKKAIAANEEKAHATELARRINDGELPVTSVALHAFGQLAWEPAPPAADKAPEPAREREKAPLLQRAEKRLASFAAMVEDQPAPSLVLGGR